MSKAEQQQQMRLGQGFVAALDQSGGSTPKALGLYGIEPSAYSSNAEMFDLIHAMRTRIATSPAFTGDRVIGAILFEMTMERQINGKPAATYLWEDRHIVPFLKVDQGLADGADGVRLMKPMPDLHRHLLQAADANIFGTKMRSVIEAASDHGIKAIVAQQFEISQQILTHHLTPIIEPEVAISIPDKAQAENILLDALTRALDDLPGTHQVILKLTLPKKANLYKSLVDHPRVMRVVALSGGYSRNAANARLAQNTGVIASFSRALTEGLSARQSDAEFNAMLAETIHSVYAASLAG